MEQLGPFSEGEDSEIELFQDEIKQEYKSEHKTDENRPLTEQQ